MYRDQNQGPTTLFLSSSVSVCLYLYSISSRLILEPMTNKTTLLYASPTVLPIRIWIRSKNQRRLNSERPTIFWVPRNLSHRMIKQTRTGDTVLVKSIERWQVGPKNCHGGGGWRDKDDRKQNTLALLVRSYGGLEGWREGTWILFYIYIPSRW